MQRHYEPVQQDEAIVDGLLYLLEAASLPALTPCPPPQFRADGWPPLLKRLLGVPQRVRWVRPATGAGYRRRERFTGAHAVVVPPALRRHPRAGVEDRKSTRLNSSHGS